MNTIELPKSNHVLCILRYGHSKALTITQAARTLNTTYLPSSVLVQSYVLSETSGSHSRGPDHHATGQGLAVIQPNLCGCDLCRMRKMKQYYWWHFNLTDC